MVALEETEPRHSTSVSKNGRCPPHRYYGCNGRGSGMMPRPLKWRPDPRDGDLWRGNMSPEEGATVCLLLQH